MAGAKRGNPTWHQGMFYQGWWAPGYFVKGRNHSTSIWVMHAFRAPFSGKGRKYHRPQVRGGRWKVRRRPDGPYNKPWYAWSDGKAGKRWHRRFETHAKAVWWAQTVADTYRKHDDDTANALLGQILKYDRQGADQEFISAGPEE